MNSGSTKTSNRIKKGVSAGKGNKCNTKVDSFTKNLAKETSKDHGVHVRPSEDMAAIQTQHNRMHNDLRTHNPLNRGGPRVVIPHRSVAPVHSFGSGYRPNIGEGFEGLSIYAQYPRLPVYPQLPLVPLYPELFSQYGGGLQPVHGENVWHDSHKQEGIIKN